MSTTDPTSAGQLGATKIRPTSRDFPALTGIADSPDDAGVTGIHNGAGRGIVGESRGSDGIIGTGAHNGVVGRSGAKNHSGVWADNTGGGFGVAGTSDAPNGVGTYGRGARVGVYGGEPGDDGNHPEATGGLAGFFAGNVMVTGELKCFDCRLSGGDCAEKFDTLDESAATPGTVMVIDEQGQLTPSAAAYDRKVAGVVSGAGHYQPGILLDSHNPSANTVALALVGKVYCQVDASSSPIEVGDLLTTAPTRGHAMKAADPLRSFGAVIGKALRPLAEGRGLIPILVALQ